MNNMNMRFVIVALVAGLAFGTVLGFMASRDFWFSQGTMYGLRIAGDGFQHFGFNVTVSQLRDGSYVLQIGNDNIQLITEIPRFYRNSLSFKIGG